MAKGPFNNYLFVDGYNIINSWPSFSHLQGEKLEESRKHLIDILVEYASYSNVKLILVFDGHLVKGNSGTKETIAGIRVVYTREFETADHFIERSVAQLDKRNRIKVATSDRLEQEIILGRGATRISARELYDEIFSSKKLIKNRQKGLNQENNYHFGKMDQDNIDRLKKILIDKGT